jgi:hypothetical protein
MTPGWRECAACKKELPQEFYRGANPRCRVCVSEGREPPQTVRIAAGITAKPTEAWAQKLLDRLR